MEYDSISAHAFKRKFGQLILITWLVPPVFGLSFLLFIRLLTPEQIGIILLTPIEPVFIIASLLFAYWYLNRCIKPVVQFLGEGGILLSETALNSMRRFPLHYWGLFLAYLLLAPASIIIAAEIYTDFVARPVDWFRIHLVALIVSIIVGLPIFFRILDLFGRAVSKAVLTRPHVTLKTKVFLIGALVPLLISTTLVQYYWTRTGYFGVDTFAMWLILELLAIVGSLLFMRSMGQSLQPLQEFIESQAQVGAMDVTQIRALSTDELGVIASDIRVLAEQLKLQNEILEIRNQILAGSSSEMKEEAIISILDICDAAFGADKSFILMYDASTNEMVNVAFTGKEYNANGYYRLPLTSGASLAVLSFKANQTISIADVTQDKRVNPLVMEQQGILSCIATPLRYGDAIIGTLIATSSTQHREFNERDVRLIEALAQETALVIHTLTLHQEQRKVEQRYRELNELAPDAILLFDSDANIVELNRTAEVLLGGREEDLVGRSVTKFIKNCEPEDLESVMLRATVGDKRLFQAELIAGNSEDVFVEIHAARLELDGKVMTQAFVRDVTRQKEAERALLLSQERLALHVEHTPLGVIEWNTDFEVVEWNPAAEKIFGYTKKEALSRHAHDLIIPESTLAHVGEIWAALVNQSGGLRSTNENITRDNNIIICEWYNTPLVNDSGDVVGVASLVRDVTDSKFAEDSIRRSEKELSSILNSLQDTFYRTDVVGRIVRVSPSVENLLGYKPEELLGTKLSDLYVDETGQKALIRELEKQNGVIKGYQVALWRKDKTAIWASTNAQYYFSDDGSIAGVEGTARDITKIRRTQEELFKEKERAQVTLESIGDGVVTTDVSGGIEYINPVAEQICGWNLDAAEGHSFEEVFCFLEEVTRQPVESPVMQCLEKRHPISSDVNIVLVGKQGREFAIEFSASPIRDRFGGLVGVVVGLHDVTEMRELAQQLTHQATHDALTGLINRREFELRLKEALRSASSEGMEHALCYLDLDQFKVVNDTCGHIAGDELLKQVTARLREKVRKADTLARLGGDEFGVLLRDCGLPTAEKVSDELRKVVKEFRFSWEDRVFEIGVSIGLVPIDANSGTLTDILSAADSACYAAKEQGRNRVHLYQPDDKVLAQRHGEMQWVSRITTALEEDRLVIFGQRIQSLHNSAGDHWEILVRMRADDGGIIPPMAFIPAAERYHVMPTIDRWVLGRSFELIAEYTKILEDRGPIFNFNLSGQSLSDDKFWKFAIDLIDKLAINPEKICFEITETAAIANLTHATRFIAIMTGIGCRFALDDFGSGLSSFAYLKNLNVSYLKIDGGFVRDMVDDPIDYAMVESINHVGHTLGIKTIAEFVESEKILHAVKNLGIDYAQGYQIGKPVPIDDDFFTNLLQASKN